MTRREQLGLRQFTGNAEDLLIGSGELGEHRLRGALPGSKLGITVKPTRKSAARPLLDLIHDADGTDLLAAGKRKQKKGADALHGAVVEAGGDGRVRIVAAPGGGVGEIRWRITLKSKKGYALELTD